MAVSIDIGAIECDRKDKGMGMDEINTAVIAKTIGELADAKRSTYLLDAGSSECEVIHSTIHATLVRVPNEILDSVRGDAWAIASCDSWREAEPRQEVPKQERAGKNDRVRAGAGRSTSDAAEMELRIQAAKLQQEPRTISPDEPA